MSADLWLPTQLPIVDLRHETEDVVTFTLDAQEQPWRFAPGQFNMLWLYGHGEVAISISGDPEHPSRLVHTIRGVGSVTKPMVALREGAVLGVRGPFGSAWPLDDADGADVIVVAGGVGLAPVRPLIYQLLHQRERFNRVIVLYGARRPRDLLFIDELHQWRGRFDTDVRVTVDGAGSDWRGQVGVVTRLIGQSNFDPDDTVVYTCGPEVMMHFVVREFIKEGVSPERIWLSMERNMKCAVGLCGHCQWGPHFVCRDGPVFRYDRIRPIYGIREL